LYASFNACGCVGLSKRLCKHAPNCRCAHLQLGNAELGNERLVNAESGNAESGNAELCNEQFGNEKQLGNVEPSGCMPQCLKNTEFKRPRKKMILTEIGKIAYDFWQSIPTHYPFVVLHEFVIMPDHMHGIIQITQKQHEGWKPNEFGNQSKNIPAIIRAYKASVKRYANEQHISFQWQARYFDALLRHQKQLRKTRNYIKKNVAMWKVVR
jgi:REP element-mobilizing transposase RayT